MATPVPLSGQSEGHIFEDCDLAAELSVLEAVGRSASVAVVSSPIETSASRQRAPPAALPARRLSHRTAISPESANGGTSAIRSPLPNRRGSYRLAGHVIGEQAHLLVGRAASSARKM
jgi:hypothetical protein